MQFHRVNLGGKHAGVASRARSWKWVATGLGVLIAAGLITPAAQPAAAVDDCTAGNTATSLADAQDLINDYQDTPPAEGEAIICFEGQDSYGANPSPLQFSNPWADARLRLIGTGSGATFTLDSGINAGFVQVTNSAVNVTVTFENLTLDGNSYSGSIVSATRLLALNVEVINSVVKNYLGLAGIDASASSGAIPGNTVTVTGSTIQNNQSPTAGGGVRARDNVVVTNSSFINNRSNGTSFFDPDGGGAIYSVAGDVLIQNSVFTDNAAALNGGAVWSGGETNIADSTFTGNFSSGGGSGGAIWGSGNILVNRSTFTNSNTAQLADPANGGAIWGAGRVDIDASTFSGNVALNGGAVYSTDLNVANSTFVRNQATAEGGAVYISSGQILFSTFYENLAAPFTDPNNDVPGDSVYKQGGDVVALGASIFTSISPYPQVGVGSVTPTPVTDTGGNVFSSSAAEEIDLSAAATLEYPASLFGRSVSAVFGSNVLTNNGGPTETVMLASNSPALCAAGTVTLTGVDLRTYDQRGVQRTNPFDSGAVDAPTPAGGCGHLAATGAPAFLGLAGLALLLLTLGILFAALRSRPRSGASAS